MGSDKHPDFIGDYFTLERVKGIEPSFDLLMGQSVFDDKAQHGFF
jgi:hypothetical protein